MKVSWISRIVRPFDVSSCLRVGRNEFFVYSHENESRKNSTVRISRMRSLENSEISCKLIIPIVYQLSDTEICGIHNFLSVLMM